MMKACESRATGVFAGRYAHFHMEIVIYPSHLKSKVGGVSAPRSNMKDESRSREASLQELASNHLKLHWSKAIVVSVKEKAEQDFVR
ncbi:MAG: hypothetical protein GY774_20920 [Planctomycetes bacterium]|nr:hypothetical protein [Planctomycetota bacterium]